MLLFVVPVHWQKSSLAAFPVLGDAGRVESILPARSSGAQHALVTSPSICELLPWLTWIREPAPSSTETLSVYNLSKKTKCSSYSY